MQSLKHWHTKSHYAFQIQAISVYDLGLQNRTTEVWWQQDPLKHRFASNRYRTKNLQPGNSKTVNKVLGRVTCIVSIFWVDELELRFEGDRICQSQEGFPAFESKRACSENSDCTDFESEPNGLHRCPQAVECHLWP